MPLILTPFRFVNFRLWCGANLISVTGTWMQVLAANWILLTVTGSATQMGFGVLLHAAPVLLLGPWAGALADRLPARPLLTVTQTVHAAISVGLALAVWGGGDVILWVYATMVLGGVVNSIEGPALGRFGSLMVDREHLGSALAVGCVSGSAGRIVGMSVGGLLIATYGAAPVFLFNAATFLVVIAVLYRLRPSMPGAAANVGEAAEKAGVPTSALAGLRYVLRDPVVLITLGLSFLLGSLGRNYQVTMAAMSAGPLQGGANGYGMLSTVFAVGAVVGGLLAARAGRMYGRHLVIVGAIMSVIQVASGLAPGVWSFAAMLLPIAAAAVVIDTVVATRLQLDKPLAVRGRVLAAVGATGAISGMVGAPVLGWLCDTMGPRGALLLAGTVTTLGCVAAAVAYAAVRRGQEAPAPAPASPASLPKRVAVLPLPSARPEPAQVTPPAAPRHPVSPLSRGRTLAPLRARRRYEPAPEPA